MHTFKRLAGCLAAALLCVGLSACTPTVDLPVVTRCTGDADSPIRNLMPAGVDAADCVLYRVEQGRLCWRALHDRSAGVLIDDENHIITAVAAADDAVFFLYNGADGNSLGRIDGTGRVEYGLCAVPDGAVRLFWSAGELFCADGAGQCYRLAELSRAEPLPVGNVWAMTSDAIIFADGAELRACLRSDYSTITALASMPGGTVIASVAIDQATEEETRIYVVDEAGQLASFADGSWSLHGGAWPGIKPASLAVIGGGCLVTDAEAVWYIDAVDGGAVQVCDPIEFFVAEDRVYPAPYDGEPITVGLNLPDPQTAKQEP